MTMCSWTPVRKWILLMNKHNLCQSPDLTKPVRVMKWMRSKRRERNTNCSETFLQRPYGAIAH